MGQIDEIKQNDKLVREYSYMYNGLLDYTDDHVDFKAVQTPVKVMRTSYGYTNHGQVDTMIYTDVSDPNVTWPNNRLEEYHYSYDKRGNITDEMLINKYEKDDNGNPVTNTVEKEYTYDSLNRLTQTTVGTTDITKYTYDKVGNKLTEQKYDDTTLENTKTNAYNEFNQLTSTTMSVPGGTAQTIATYSYDDRGNQILAHKRDFGATTWYDTTYQYDRAGYMQKSVTEKPGGITETVGHYYNGMEQRIRKVVDQNTTKYVYTGTTVLFTADDNNDKITENILSPGGQIVASNRFDGIFNGNAFFFNQDIRNSTTAIINKDLEALKYYEYDEQGREEEKGNPNFINENTFTGAISEGNDIYYMNARFYDANTGRFLSQDSYTGNAYEPWSQHLYSYCGNNPVNMIDPTGHWGERLNKLASGGAFMVAGAMAIAVGLTIATGGIAAPLVVVAGTLGAAAGTAAVAVGAAEVVESMSGENYIMDDVFDGDVETYEKNKRLIATTAVGATTFAGTYTALQQAGKIGTSVAINKLLNNPCDPYTKGLPRGGQVGYYIKSIQSTGEYGQIYAKELTGSLEEGLYQIVNGHHRVEALKKLGYEVVKILQSK